MFGPDLVRRLLLAFAAKESPRAVRARLGREAPWERHDARRPRPGVNWPRPSPRWSSCPRSRGAARRGAREAPAPPREARRDLALGHAPGPPRPWRRARRSCPARVSAPPAAPRPAALDEGLRLGDARGRRSSARRRRHRAERRRRAVARTDDASAFAAALRGYSHQAKVLDQRLRPTSRSCACRAPTGCCGTSSSGGASFTTHGLNVVRVTPEPGALSVAIARPKREVVSFATAARPRGARRRRARQRAPRGGRPRARRGPALPRPAARPRPPHAHRGRHRERQVRPPSRTSSSTSR